MTWISAKDRMPEDSLYYLIHIEENKEFRIAFWRPTKQQWYEQIDQCHGKWYHFDRNRISHWMPLPKGPDELD